MINGNLLKSIKNGERIYHLIESDVITTIKGVSPEIIRCAVFRMSMFTIKMNPLLKRLKTRGQNTLVNNLDYCSLYYVVLDATNIVELRCR